MVGVSITLMISIQITYGASVVSAKLRQSLSWQRWSIRSRARQKPSGTQWQQKIPQNVTWRQDSLVNIWLMAHT